MRRKYSLRPLFLSLIILSAIIAFSLVSHSILGDSRVLDVRQLQPSGRGHDPEKNEACHLVHDAKDQCAFIKANCPDEEAGVFSYLTLYYCRMPDVKPIGFIIIASWLGLLFATIGIAASDFLCVNLSTVAALLGMSESFTGVTFLAFGNGSPDVFSTLAAMKSHSGSLAIGELIGAASFISAVVVGSMAVIRPFKVAKRTFVREVGFFLGAVGFSMVFLANGKLELWESAVMVCFYIFYVVTVVIWHWWVGQRRRRREREALARGHYIIPGQAETDAIEEYHDDEDEGRSRQGSSYRSSANVSIDDLRQLENQGDMLESFPELADEDNEEARDRMLGELNSNMRLRRPGRGSRRNTMTPIRPSLLGALEFQTVLHSLAKSRNLQAAPIYLRRYSDDSQQMLSDQMNQSTTLSVIGTDNRKSVSVDILDGHARAPSTRARAVSANDAARPRLGARPIAGTIPEIDFLSASPPEIGSTLSDRGNNQLDGISHSAVSESPLLSITPPFSATGSRESSPPPMGSRSHAQDFLAPPTHRQQPGLLPSVLASQRTPHLTITPPARNPPISKHKHSPRIPPLSTYFDFPVATSPTRSSSLHLPSPIQGSEPFFPHPHPSEEADIGKPLSWWPYNILPAPRVFQSVLFPTLNSWSAKNWWERGFSLVSAPSIFLLTITIPVLEAEDAQKEEKVSEHIIPVPSTPPLSGQTSEQQISQSEHSSALTSRITSSEEEILDKHPREWNRWLLIIQCFTAPYFITLNIWVNYNPSAKALVLPTLYSLLASLLLLALVLITTTPSQPPRVRIVPCLLGFSVSIAWLSAIAGEIVGSLKTIGVIFNISDAILGLTVFAVGNSINDLVADITIARLGYPVMALSACFAGPMLNILLGIGIGGLWMTISGANKHHHKHPSDPIKYQPYHIDVSYTLLISAIALLITLVGLLIVVPLNGWRLDKRIGSGLIALWCVATVINLAAEITGWDDDVA